jgi:hypothetical protein
VLAASVAFARIPVTVIDTGINIDANLRPYICETKDFTGETMVDLSGHGTNVAGLIVQGLDPSKVCLKVYKFFLEKDDGRNLARFKHTLHHTLENRPEYLNLSLSGAGYDREENYLLGRLTDLGTRVVVAAGNEAQDLERKCWIYPACHNISTNFIVVGAKALWSNKKGPVDYYGTGGLHCYKSICKQGTSQETAIYLNKVLKLQTKGR